MKNEKPKSWGNVPYKTWKYQKQTEMKHRVFGYYLPLWLRILGKSHKNLNYVDGFGGLGAYHTDEDMKNEKCLSRNFGSPIISMLSISDLQRSEKIGKANILVIDRDARNIDNMKGLIDFLKINIKNGVINFKQGNFDKEINGFLNRLDVKNLKLSPTFFLIDPFGIADIKMETIKRIMNRDKTEILLNFMYNCLQRFIDHPDEKINKIYDEYFGGGVWGACKGKKLKEKEGELVNIFRNNCKKFCKFVYPFRLKFPYKNQTYYYLFHLSQHYKGCSLMKDSFAKFNNGRDEYAGEKYKSQSGLFDSLIEKEKRENFIGKLIKKYKGEAVRYVNIIEDFIDETDLLEREIKKLLQKLESENKIEVQAGNNRNRRSGFDEGDSVYFV